VKLLHRYRLALALLLGLLVFPICAYATGQVVVGTVSFNASFTEAATAVGTYQIPVSSSLNLSYTNGTASNQVDTIYAKTFSLASTTQTIDLTSLTDPAGNSINFARVREFIVVNTSTTAGYDLEVYSGSSNGWAPIGAVSGTPCYVRYGSGAMYRLSDPVSTGSGNGNVVGSTSKTITFNSGSNTVTFYVIVVGGSAA
jgi:hypothetical protein